MFYKILNKLFGIDYVIVKHGYDSKILPVDKDFDGNVFYKHWGNAFLILNKEKVLWITCESSKYFVPKEKPVGKEVTLYYKKDELEKSLKRGSMGGSVSFWTQEFNNDSAVKVVVE
jgi:hypothetical protein